MNRECRIKLKPRALAAVFLPLLAIGMIGNAAAYTVPAGLGTESGGPPPAGHPGFYNVSSLKFERLASGAYRLTGTGTGGYEFDRSPAAGGSWSVSNASFKLVANWSRWTDLLGGTLSSGTVDITGKIPGFVGTAAEKAYSYRGSNDVTNTTGNLYHANLKLAGGTGTDNTPRGLGFTTLAASDTGWASQFMTDNESVWFYNQNIWRSIVSATLSNLRKNTWSIAFNNVSTITTVPVPAAAWLLGSGLMVLAGVRRKSNCAAMTV
jgi:hypothetical protein